MELFKLGALMKKSFGDKWCIRYLFGAIPRGAGEVDKRVAPSTVTGGCFWLWKVNNEGKVGEWKMCCLRMKFWFP